VVTLKKKVMLPSSKPACSIRVVKATSLLAEGVSGGAAGTCCRPHHLCDFQEIGLNEGLGYRFRTLNGLAVCSSHPRPKFLERWNL
jgi:hypothetical protein